MQLTQFTDYCLRTLLYLGARPGEITPASGIAEAYGISANHVAKVAKWLTREGIVRARRGSGGGLELAVEPIDLCIGELVRRTEPHLDLLECFDASRNTCPLSGACALERVLHDARDAFLAVLDDVTLADLLHNAPQLVRLLGH